jgi:ribosomal-protein-serine acetyltransferase
MITISPAEDLLLREPRDEDAAELFALIDANRIALGVWMPWLDQMRNMEDSLAYVRFSRDGNREGRFLNLLVWHHGQAIGVVCYFAIEPTQRRAEIGYWLGEAWQGRGMMTRACAALIEYGYTALDLYRIQIACAVDNQASRAVPLRLGFTLEGVLRGRECIGKRVLDHAIYGLLLPEWQEQQSLAGTAGEAT